MYKLFVIIFCVCVSSCASHPKINKLLIKQRLGLDSSNILFWCTNIGGISSQTASFFQIAMSSSEVCQQNANVYCEVAIQIYGIVKDTIYILAATKLINVKQSNYVFKHIEYSPELFDLTKKPSDTESFIIEEACGKNKKE